MTNQMLQQSQMDGGSPAVQLWGLLPCAPSLKCARLQCVELSLYPDRVSVVYVVQLWGCLHPLQPKGDLHPVDEPSHVVDRVFSPVLGMEPIVMS